MGQWSVIRAVNTKMARLVSVRAERQWRWSDGATAQRARLS